MKHTQHLEELRCGLIIDVFEETWFDRMCRFLKICIENLKESVWQKAQH